MSDTGFVHLRELPQLRRLGLENSQVGDGTLRQLHVLAQLESLDLRPRG